MNITQTWTLLSNPLFVHLPPRVASLGWLVFGVVSLVGPVWFDNDQCGLVSLVWSIRCG